MNFSGKIVLITGAGSGIGEQLTYRLLQEGAYVVIAGRRREKLEEVRARSVDPDSVLVVPTDVTQFSAIENLVKRALDEKGRINVLINNAGTVFGGAVEDVRPSEVEYLTKVNLIAPMWLVQLTLPILKKQLDGMIVNVSSMAGLVSVPYQSFYCATKQGLRGFSEALRRELLGTSIKVLTVYPGTVESEIINNEVQDKMREVKFRVSGIMSSERTAQLILNAMKNEEAHVVIAGKERLLVKVDKWAPRLLDFQLQMLAPKIRKILTEANKWTRQRAGFSEDT